MKMESAALPVGAVQMAEETPRPLPPMRKPTRKPTRKQQEAKNLQSRLKEAEEQGVTLTGADRANPNYRRRAAAGEGKAAAETRSKDMANPEIKWVNLRRRQRTKALPKAELELVRNMNIQSKHRDPGRGRETRASGVLTCTRVGYPCTGKKC
ncbi:unnamed protein product [Ectocarpus fasciculatus]